MMKRGILSFLMTLLAFSISLAVGAEKAKELELEVRGMT